MEPEIARNRKRGHVLLAMAAALAGSACSAIRPPSPSIMHRTGPSEFEFNRAMETADVGGPQATGEVCRPVRLIACVPGSDRERVACTFRYQRDRMGTAVLERHARVFWRWVSGPRACTARVPGRPVSEGP